MRVQLIEDDAALGEAVRDRIGADGFEAVLRLPEVATDAEGVAA